MENPKDNKSSLLKFVSIKGNTLSIILSKTLGEDFFAFSLINSISFLWRSVRLKSFPSV